MRGFGGDDESCAMQKRTQPLQTQGASDAGKDGIEGPPFLDRIERGAHASRPAREVLGAHAGEIHGVDFTREIVERDADEECGSGTEEAMDCAGELGRIGE